MEAKVLIDFIDKETKEYRKAGSVFEVSEERSKEILAAGNYIKVMEQKTTPQNPDEEKPEKSVDEMTVNELKEYAKAHDIKLNGAKTKDEILEAIKATE